MRTKILAAVTVICMIAFLFALQQEYREEKRQKTYYEELTEATAALEDEKEELEQELQQLEREYASQTDLSATVQILFVNPADALYEDVWPELQQREMSALLAVSEEAFPGTEGMLTTGQCRELLDDGWDICLAWPGEEEADFSDWLYGMQDKLEEAKLASDLTGLSVYFPEGSWEASYADILTEAGCIAAVCEEDSADAVVRDGFGKEELWYPNAYFWRGSGGSSLLKLAVDYKGNLVFAIDWTMCGSSFEDYQFDAMLNTCVEYEESEDLQMLDFTETASMRQSAEEETDPDEAYLEEKNRLETLLEEKEEEIQEAREAYREEHGEG